MRGRQIITSGEVLWAHVPEGNLPETITIDGIEFTVEQISAIYNSQHGILTVQRLSKRRLAVRNTLLPPGVWAIYQPEGGFQIHPQIPLAMAPTSKKD